MTTGRRCSVPIISFARWVKRRRRAALALVRDGDLVDVKVTQAIRTSGDGPHTFARVELPDGALATLDFYGHPESLTEGAVNLHSCSPARMYASSSSTATPRPRSCG